MIINSDVIIHPGLQKTGTTWIQKELFERMNVQYFHNMDFTTYMNPNKKTIISMEWLAGVPSFSDVPYKNRFQIADKMHELFPNAKILLGLREKNSWINSLYSQYIKDGGICNYSIWKNDIFNDEFLNYDEYVAYLKEKFSTVKIYWLNEMKKDIHLFAKDICSFIDEPVPNYKVKFYNKKFKKEQLEKLRIINKFFKSEYNKKGILPDTMGKLQRSLVKNIGGSW